MTMQRAVGILETERECVERAGTATPNKACDRSCADCDLVLDDKEILEAYNMAIKALEQEPCEDEYIKVPKKALKYRTAGMVAYNAEWLKNHFDMERAIICGEQEPCEDCISRKAVLDINESHHGQMPNHVNHEIWEEIKALPPITPQPDTARRIVGKSRGGMTLWYQCERCNEPVDVQDTFCSGCGRRLVNGCEKQAEEGQ